MSSTILVTDCDYPDLSIERSTLDGTDIDLVSAQATTAEEVIEAAADAEPDGLLVQYAPITESVLAALDVRAVGRYGIGVDNVDLDAATHHGVQVVNVPDYCIEEVATHALALLLSCARKTANYDREVRAGEWDWKAGTPIDRIAGSTLGLVGFGQLPRRLVDLVAGFGFEVLVADPYVDADEIEDAGCEPVAFEELLDRSRFVSLHAPLNEDTRRMIDAAALDAMREDSVLVNTARGGLIDTGALREALDDERIAGAGIDVLPEEPPDPAPPFEHPNVVYTPHAAWYSEDSITDLRRTLAADVAGILRGESPKNPVNELG